MDEYISKQAFKEKYLCCGWLPEMSEKEFDDLPAADVAPVRNGRWMTTDAYPHHLYCSVCYKTYAKNAKWVNELDLPTNYCPNCGALMREVGSGEK